LGDLFKATTAAEAPLELLMQPAALLARGIDHLLFRHRFNLTN